MMPKPVGTDGMNSPIQSVGAGVAPTKTVVICWVEESHHRAVVRVPRDFNPDERDLANGLAELHDDGFVGLQRSDIEVADAAEDPTAQFFDPPHSGEAS
jgi:hypothetical protein